MKKALISALVAAYQLVAGGTALAAEKNTIVVQTVGHLKGAFVEAVEETTWTNNTSADVSLVFDPGAGVTGATVAIPAGATPFTQSLAAGATETLTFTALGLYRFALVFADGTVKSGELAVVAADPDAVDVSIVGIAFAPKVLTAAAGKKIRWINTTTMAHTVTTDPTLAANAANAAVPAGAEAWHSGDIAPGGSFTKELTVVGTYKYFCKPHETMGHVGSVVIQ